MFGKTMALQRRRTMPPSYCRRASPSAILAGTVPGANVRRPVRFLLRRQFSGASPEGDRAARRVSISRA